jgi:FkbM family methyltransferase
MSFNEVMRMALGAVPVSVSINGRRQYLVYNLLDPMLRRRIDREIDTAFGRIRIDPAHRPERLLAYAWGNVLSYYVNSPLGRYMASLNPEHGAVFVDIGANLGMYSLLAQRRGFHSILFEPEPKHTDFLKRNAAMFGQVFAVALSDFEGEAELFVGSEQNTGESSLVAVSGSPMYADSVKVPVTTFSALVERGKIDPARVRLIKVDVEGVEAATLRGMTSFFTAGYRPTIWCEVRSEESTRQRGSYKDICRFMAPFGYAPFDCDGWQKRPIDLAIFKPPHPVFDILFVAV